MSSSADEDETSYLTKKRQQKIKKQWTTKETRALLEAYERHKVDFKHGVKIKIFGMIGEELEAAGILTSPVNAEMVHNKFKSLQKGCRLSGERAPFYAKVIELFGTDNAEDLEAQLPVASLHLSNDAQSVKEELQDCDDEMSYEDPLLNQAAYECQPKPPLSKGTTYHERRFAQRQAMFREMEDNKARRHAASEKAKERRHQQKMRLLEKYLSGAKADISIEQI